MNIDLIVLEKPQHFSIQDYPIGYQRLGNLTATKAVLIFDLPLQPTLLLDKFYPLFQEEFQIILCQLPAQFPVAFEQGSLMKELLSTLSKKADARTFYLVGGSLATPYVINAALSQPALIESVLLYSPILEISTPFRSAIYDMLWALDHPRKDYLFPSRFLNLFIKEERHFSDYQKQLEILNRSHRAELASHIKGLREWIESFSSLPSLNMPVQIFLGDDDIFFSLGYTKRIQAILSQARVLTLSKAGHFCLQDSPYEALKQAHGVFGLEDSKIKISRATQTLL